MTRALLVTGTSSSAGKSLFVTALCRYFTKKGIRVAPFKAQNMSLQSFVCKDGGEIGLAQALQAFACKIEPESSFNPILLKPEGNAKCQVILKGRLYKSLSAKDYYKEKKLLWEEVRTVLEDLCKRFELLICEGAGSPAEINLLKVDLVNILPALHLKCPIILIADIDKGGVFASIYGTVKLLEHYLPNYVKLFKGFVINKFRGDLEILKPGIRDISQLTGLECLGVLPYLEDIYISDEDGFSFFGKITKRKHAKGELRIAVLPLRHISNFADLDPLYLEEDVEILFSFRKEDLISSDLIIIPGSKNTISDLKWLKSIGLIEVLKEAIKKGAEVLGICGGYQMLGEVLKNPLGIEGHDREIQGMGLLEGETLFSPEKITSQVLARPLSQGVVGSERERLWGYEIHKGITLSPKNLFEIWRYSTGEILLDGQRKGPVWGTYIHGLFTNDAFRRSYLNYLRERKGLKPLPIVENYWKRLDRNIEILSQKLEEYIDMKKIEKILDL